MYTCGRSKWPLPVPLQLHLCPSLEKSQTDLRPYSFPMLGSSLAAATWPVPADTEPGTGQSANLPPEGCFSLLTRSLIFFFHLFGFLMFSSLAKRKKKASANPSDQAWERESLSLFLAAVLTAINCPPTRAGRVEPEFP